MNLEILNKYIENRCSQEELEQIQAWLQEDRANEDFFQTFVEAQQCEPTEVGDISNAWDDFKKNHLNNSKKPVAKLYDKKYKTIKAGRKAKKQQWLKLGAVAAVLGLLVVALFVFRDKIYSPSKQVAPKVSYRTIVTQKGQQTRLRLKDGTLVMLNAASKLRIPKNYGVTKRVVYLHGEAFFEVTHNEAMPFKVKLGELVIKDLGTAFNISAYDSTDIAIAVKEGAVSVGKKPEESGKMQLLGQLNKGLVGYAKGDSSFSISKIHDMALFTGWTKGKLVFRNTPFLEVVKHLERRFNVKGKILSRKLKKRTLTATYDQLSLDQILNVLSVSLHISYRHQNNTIVFKPKNAN